MLLTNAEDPWTEAELEVLIDPDGKEYKEAELRVLVVDERGNPAKGAASVVLVDPRKLGPETVAHRLDGGREGLRGVKLNAFFTCFAQIFLGVDVSEQSADNGPSTSADSGSSTIISTMGPQSSARSLTRKKASKS